MQIYANDYLLGKCFKLVFIIEEILISKPEIEM